MEKVLKETRPSRENLKELQQHLEGNQSYRPWTKRGVIRSPHGGPVEVSILRDTGASQSLLLRSKLPKGVIEATRETVMIEGIGGKRGKNTAV